MIEQEFVAASSRAIEDQDVSGFDAPELSPQQYAEHTANMMANAFQATRLFEVVEVKAGPGQVHLLGRVKKEKEKAFVEMVVHPSLAAMQDGAGSGFIGKQFLLKNGGLKYAWVISFAAENLRDETSRVCNSFADIIPRREVMEAPLIGGSAPQSGGLATGRKGAHAIR